MLILIEIAAALLIAYGGAVLMLYLMQDRMIFVPRREVYRDPSAFGWQFEEIVLSVDGHSTHGWYVPLTISRGTVLFSHGNAGNIADRLESIDLLRSFGFSVLVYDYGGYGRSGGVPSEQRCFADARAMWRYLTETKRIAPEKIVVFGRSLGGAVAAQLASEVKPAAVVIESTFLSIAEVGREKYPWAPVRWFVRHPFTSRKVVPGICAPILIVHSPEDTLIPIHHGRELYNLASSPKEFLEISGDHRDGFLRSENVYRQGWERFLAPLLPYPDLLD